MTSNEGWAKVPSALILSDLPAGAVRLYGYLAWRQGENESTWPKWETISADLQMSRRTIAYNLRYLERAGWITKDSGRGGEVNHYTVSMEGATSCTRAKRTPQQGAKRAPHHDEVEPSNKKQSARRTKKGGDGDPRVAPLIREIAETCRVDLAITQNWKWLGKESKELLAAGYDIPQIRQFLSWWLADSWRATHTPIPTVKKLRELIGQAIHGADTPAGRTAVIDLGCNDESCW